MEFIKDSENNNKKKTCTVCNKDFKLNYLKKHITTKLHLKNVQEHIFIKKDLKLSSIINIKRATKIINEIMKNNNLNNDINMLHDILKKKYSNNTIENYLRLGFINNKQIIFTPFEKQQNMIFMRNLKDKIFNERNEKEKNIKDVKISDININTDSPYYNLLKLYTLLPLRAGDFIRIKTVAYKCSISSMKNYENFNYICADETQLILHKTKTTIYEEIDLDKGEAMKFLFSVGCMHHQIYDNPIYDKSKRSFERLIKKELGYNTQEIRKIFANSHLNDVSYASRILNHGLGTHLTKYVSQEDMKYVNYDMKNVNSIENM
jgi:hypothetical protein